MKVIKKLGNLVDYDNDKVFQVVLNAIEDARAIEGVAFDDRHDVVLASDISDDIDQLLQDSDDEFIHAEDLANLIYETIVNHEEVIAAREYLHYSDKKAQKHGDAEELQEAISKVFNNDHDTVHENGNKDARKLTTKRDLIASQVFRTLGLKMFSPDVQKAHKEGLIHLHKESCASI